MFEPLVHTQVELKLKSLQNILQSADFLNPGFCLSVFTMTSQLSVAARQKGDETDVIQLRTKLLLLWLRSY